MRVSLVFFLVLCLAFVRSNPLAVRRTNSPIELVSIIRLEEACVRQGGICMREDECQPENLSQVRGVLCPMQKSFGIECCYL